LVKVVDDEEHHRREDRGATEDALPRRRVDLAGGPCAGPGLAAAPSSGLGGGLRRLRLRARVVVVVGVGLDLVALVVEVDDLVLVPASLGLPAALLAGWHGA